MKSLAESLVLAPRMLRTDAAGVLLVCAIADQTEGYMITAIARVDLALDNAVHHVASDLADFFVDTHPDRVCLCWLTTEHELHNEESVQRTRVASILRELCVLIEQSPHLLTTEITTFYTDRQKWGELTLKTGVLTSVGQLAPYSRLLETPLACELMLEENEPAEGIWGRVAFRRRKLSSDAEKRYRDDPDDVHGRLLWANTLKKVQVDFPDLLPHRTVHFLGGTDRIGKLNAALHDAEIRDRILLWVVTGKKIQEDVEWENCYSFMRQASMNEEVIQRARQAIRVLNACGSFSADDSPCAYGTIAYIYWWLGETQSASTAAKMSLCSDSSYRMANLITAILGARIMPPWMK
ncbi:DUF4192 family protein [Arcanobacterium buesumense]|nr:DUF4192 family protein [Arcanobacterium buesumense]